MRKQIKASLAELEAQGLEQRLKELDAEISSLPRRITLLQAPLAAQQAEIDRAAAATAMAQAERRKMESQIQDLKTRVAKSRNHSAEVKTNQEYKAVLDEITYSEGEISRCEERILQLMEEIEGHEAAAREVEAKRAQIQAEVDAAKDPALAREFEVFHLPAVFVFVDGTYHCALHSEARPERIEAALQSALAAPEEEGMMFSAAAQQSRRSFIGWSVSACELV